MSALFRFHTVLFILCTFANSIAAQTPIDSIKQLIEDSNDVKHNVEHYTNLISIASVQNPQLRETYAQELKKYAESHNSISGQARAMTELGYFNLLSGKLEQAIVHYKESERLLKDELNAELSIRNLNNISICYERLGNHDNVLEYAMQAMALAEESKSKKQIATTKKRLAEVYGYILNDREKGLNYVDEALETFRELDDQSLVVQGLLTKGTIYLNYNTPLGIEILSEAEAMAEQIDKNSGILTYIRSSLIYCYYQSGDFPKAIDVVNKNLKHAEQIGEEMMIGNSHASLGDIYLEMGRNEKAQYHFELTLSYATKTENTQLEIIGHAGMGRVMRMKDIDEAIYHYQIAVEKSDSINLDHMRMQAIPLLADTYAENNEFQKAEEQLDRARSFGYDANPETALLINHTQAKLYTAQNQINKAEPMLIELYDQAVASGQNNISLFAAEQLADIYSQKMKYKKAYYWKNIENNMMDSLNIIDNRDQLTELRKDAEFAKEKEIIDIQNEKEQAVLKERQKRSTILSVAALIGLCLVTLFYFLLRQKNQKIKAQNMSLEYLNNTKDTLFQIIGHDLKKPTIGFRNISKNINYLLEKEDYSRLKALGEDVDRDAKSLYTLTDNLLNWALVQKDSLNIQLENVKIYDIVEENIELFSSIAQQKKIQLVNQVDPTHEAYIDRNSLDTIIRNLIDNALKYTDVNGRIELSSQLTNDIVHVGIQDNGSGISAEMRQAIRNDETIRSTVGTFGEKGSGLGIHLVKQLLHKNKSSLHIEDSALRGTKFSIAIPKAS